MAAGRYRDDEFRGRGSDAEVSRREIGYRKSDYGRVRNGARDRGYDRRSRDRGTMLRSVDIQEREIMNVGYYSGSSNSNSGSSGGIDREPGELSSECGSDGAVDSEIKVKDSKVRNLVSGDQSSPSKKRKFSPIIWDKDDKTVNRMSNGKSSHIAAKVPPQPPVQKCSNQSANSRLGIAAQNHCVTDDNVQNAASESCVDVSLLLHDEVRLSKEQEAKTLEDADFVSVPTIRSSRWATIGADSPADEGEISDDEMFQLKNGKAASHSESSGCRKSLTPEFGDSKIDGSVGNRARSSESDDRVRSSNDLDNNDSMDVDKDRSYGDTSFSQSDTESEDYHDSRGTPGPSLPPQRSLNMLQGCRSVDEFERLNKIDEGTYGVVFRARDKKTGEIVALKKVKMEKEREGFPLTSLREINILLSFHHPAIVDVKEVVIGRDLDSIFMVMEYMEHDLKALMETMKQRFNHSEVKCLMLQLLEGVKYLHDNWVLHRDLKTSNLLLNNQGELKICDFGLARQYGSPLKPYTQLVVTLWYRAPELLLGAKQYSTAIDMWSLGCIMAELLSKKPLFNGKSEVDQLDKIFRILGTPNETIWPGLSKLPGVKVNFVKHKYNLLRKEFPATNFRGDSPTLSDAGFDLLNKLLTYDPDKRITAEAALKHEWFREVPLPMSKEFMPTFPAQHAQDRRIRRVIKSPDPLKEQQRKELQQGKLGTGGLFC